MALIWTWGGGLVETSEVGDLVANPTNSSGAVLAGQICDLPGRLPFHMLGRLVDSVVALMNAAFHYGYGRVIRICPCT